MSARKSNSEEPRRTSRIWSSAVRFFFILDSVVELIIYGF